MTAIRGPFFRERYVTEVTGRSMTKQAHKGECDINNILKKFRDQGVITHRNTFEGNYGDFTEVPLSYHDAMNQVREADEMFQSIPAHVRAEFQNDPGKFLEFVQNPQNAQKMYDLGLSNSPPAKQEAAEPPQTEPEAKSPASPEASGEA